MKAEPKRMQLSVLLWIMSTDEGLKNGWGHFNQCLGDEPDGGGNLEITGMGLSVRVNSKKLASRWTKAYKMGGATS